MKIIGLSGTGFHWELTIPPEWNNQTTIFYSGGMSHSIMPIEMQKIFNRLSYLWGREKERRQLKTSNLKISSVTQISTFLNLG